MQRGWSCWPGMEPETLIRGWAVLALTAFREHLSGPDAPIRARNGLGFVEISANQGVAPADLSRMITFEIGFSDSHVRGTNTLAHRLPFLLLQSPPPSRSFPPCVSLPSLLRTRGARLTDSDVLCIHICIYNTMTVSRNVIVHIVFRCHVYRWELGDFGPSPY